MIYQYNDTDMQQRIRAISKRLIANYGSKAQTEKCIEEMAELTSALLHFKNGRCTKDDVVTEIADVLFTAAQMAVLFGEHDVTVELLRKVERTEKKIETAELKRMYYGD